MTDDQIDAILSLHEDQHRGVQHISTVLGLPEYEVVAFLTECDIPPRRSSGDVFRARPTYYDQWERARK